MIRKKDSNVKEQKRSDLISQECDLVEELSNQDMENIAGGRWSDENLLGIIPIEKILQQVFKPYHTHQ